MNDAMQVSQANLQNKVKEEAERYLNIYRPTHGHLVLDDQYMKQIKASLEYGLLTRILSDIESVDVDYLNQLVERLGESLSANTEFKLKELSNAISLINNQVSDLNIQAIRDSIAAEIYSRFNDDSITLGLRLKALEDALGKLSNNSNNATRDLQLELVSITDGINSKVSAIEQTVVSRTADDILLASKVSQLEAIYEDNNKRLLARIREENESRINGYEALTQQITKMVSQVNNSTSTLDEVKRTYSSLEQSYSERISTLESSFKANDKDIKAKLKEQTRTFTDADKALAEKVTNLETNIDGKIGAKFNETIETISSKEEALARRISELNTSFLGLNGKLEGTIREEIKSVSDANKVHLSKLEELEGKTDTTLGKIESLKETIVTPEQVTNIVTDELVAKYSNAKDKIVDTRDTNELPRYYYTKYPNALAREIKLSAVIGIDGEGELGYLETQTIGTNYREGRVTQVFYCEDGDTYKRVSITEDIWNVWKLQETDESAKEKLRLALLEIQQKIIESEARIETYNRTHSDATKALAESLKQLEADYKEGDRVVNSRIVTLEQVQSTVDSASAETLQQLTSTLDEVKGSIRNLQSTVINPDGTVAVSEEMIRSLILDETKIKDTKDVNNTPEWYVNNHLGKSTKELKTSKVIGLTQNGDAYLETTVLSTSVSKGSVKQEVVAEDGKIYTRQSTGLRTWSNWVQSEDSLTATARLTKAKEDLERELAKVYSEFTDFKKTKTQSDSAEALRVQGLSTKLESDFGTLQGLIRSEETSRLEQDKSINKRIDNISSNLGDNYATIKSVNETKATLTESIAKKGEEITSGFDSKLIEERNITNLAIKTSADDVTEALVSKIDEYKNVANNAKSTIDNYKRTNDDAVKALGERQSKIKGEYTQDIVDAKVAIEGIITTTKDELIDNIDTAKKGLETTIGEVRVVANKAKSDIEEYAKTLNNATQSIAQTKKDMNSRFETTETLITGAKEDAVRLAKEGAIDLIGGVKTELKKHTDAGISASENTQAEKNKAFANEYKELKASISTLPTTAHVEAKVNAEREARVNGTEALVKQITKGSAKYPNGTGNVNEVSTVLNDIIRATADSSFVNKSSTFKATVHREVDEKMFRDAGNLLTDTINYSTWGYGKHTSETIVPRLIDGVWELNGASNTWRELFVLSKEGSKLDSTKAQESLVQVSEGSEYILEFEAKGNTSLIVFIRVYYKVGTTSRVKQITSTVALNSTWTKHRVQVKCPELETNEIRDYIGIYFQSTSVGNIEIRKPRLYLDPSVLNAAIKEYKQMNLDMKGNLDAKIGLTVDNGNRIIGWTATEKNNSSEFNIMADKFKISNSSRTNTPFSIDGNGVISFNGKVNFSNVTSVPSIPTQNDVNTWATNQINTQNPVIKGIIDTIPDNSTISNLAKAEADKKDAAINAVGSRIDNLSVGGLNYIRDSLQDRLVSNPTRYIKYTTGLETITQPFVFSAYVKNITGNNGSKLTVVLSNPNHNNSLEQMTEAQIINNRIIVKFNAPTHPTNTSILVYANSNGWGGSASGSVTYYKAKMEFGNTATDWTPAPEDVDARVNSINTNLFAEHSPVTTSDYKLIEVDLLTAPKQGELVTITLRGQVGEGRTLRAFNTGGSAVIGNLEEVGSGMYQLTAPWNLVSSNGSNAANTKLFIYQFPNTASSTSRVDKVVMQYSTSSYEVNKKIDNLKLGGRNLLKDSKPNVTNSAYGHRFALTEAPKVGDEVTVTLWGNMANDRQRITVFNSHGYTELLRLVKVSEGVYQGTGTWALPRDGNAVLTPNNTHLNVYFYPSSATSNNTINKIKLEYGNKGTDWSPAPEDVDSSITTAKTEAIKTASEDATTKANKAKTDAVEDASQDASTKADKAKAAAITEARQSTVLTTTQDLNTLVKSGTYFIKASNNTNSPISAWLYVSVEGNETDRVLQTVTQDSNDSIRYTRRKHGNTWTNWTKVVNEADVNNIVSNLKIPHILTAQGAHHNDGAWMKINSHTGPRTLAYTASEGIVVQILNPATLVVELTKVYPKTAAGYLSMKDDLTAVATHRIAMIVSRTNLPIVNDNNLRDALRRAGSTDLIYATLYRRTDTTFALIGRVGVAGSAYESTVDTGSDMYGQLASVSALWNAGELLPSNQTMIDGGRIVTNSITATQIAANAITANEINTNAIKTKHIEAGAVNTEQIYSKAIKTQHIDTKAINATHIDTNSIKTEHLEAKSITVDKIQDANITNAKIADGAITNAKIGNAAIKNANIENGAITSAKIGTAQVDTLQIAGEAVVVPRVQFTQNVQSFYSIDTQEEINRVSLDAQGGAVAISFGFEGLYAKINNRGNDPTIYLRIKRGSTVLRTMHFKPHNKIIGVENYKVYVGSGKDAQYEERTRLVYDDFNYEFITLPTITDVPPNGLQTYTVTLESRGLNAGKNSSQQANTPVEIYARSLQVMAVKR